MSVTGQEEPSLPSLLVSSCLSLGRGREGVVVDDCYGSNRCWHSLAFAPVLSLFAQSPTMCLTMAQLSGPVFQMKELMATELLIPGVTESHEQP